MHEVLQKANVSMKQTKIMDISGIFSYQKENKSRKKRIYGHPSYLMSSNSDFF